MRKITAIILVTALVFAICAPFSVSAAPRALNIPKAATAPTFDGVINADEWEGALVVSFNPSDEGVEAISGDLAGLGNNTFHFMWGDEGIYFAVISNGNNDPVTAPTSGGGSYNAGNGVQFNVFTSRDVGGGDLDEAFFFSYHPKTSDGLAEVGEHFVYGSGSGEDVPEAKIAVVFNGNDYTMEGLIATASLAKSTPPIAVALGATLIWNNVIMFTDGDGAQGLAYDGSWFAGTDATAYTLVADLAGIGSVVVEEEAPPAVEEEVPAVGGGDEAPEPPPVQRPPSVNTGDAGMIALIALMASAAFGIVVVLRKKAVR